MNTKLIDIPLGLKPMLAKDIDFKRIDFNVPLLVEPKIDGIRALAVNGVALSRTLKPIPNKHIQKFFMDHAAIMHGWDGELTVGEHDKTVFQRTTSGVMSEAGTPDFKYHVFDLWGNNQRALVRKQMVLSEVAEAIELRPYMSHWLIANRYYECVTEEEVYHHRAQFVAEGYEGLIARRADTYYKYGRSTAIEQALLKWKEYKDEEGEVVGFEELRHNGNEAKIDALGHTKRSSHKDNKIPGNTLGALIVRSAGYDDTVNVGTGFDMALRQKIWDNRPAYLGKIVKYKHFPIGAKDLPRHPTFLGFRNPIDIGG